MSGQVLTNQIALVTGASRGIGRAIALELARQGAETYWACHNTESSRLLAEARRLAEEAGIETEVLDLRSLQPWDQQAVADSVRRTSRLLVAYEDHRSFGYGAEIAARISGVTSTDGDSSTTFWLRRWVEQSRSPRCTPWPWRSKSTWTSTCRAPTSSRSRMSRSSPNARSASRRAAASSSGRRNAS